MHKEKAKLLTTGVVVGCIFFSADELFRMEKLTIGSSSDFVDDGWLQIDKDGSRDVLASSSFGEEGVEGIISTSNGFVCGHLAIRLDSVFKAEKLPARVTNLATGLTNVDGDAFSHCSQRIDRTNSDSLDRSGENGSEADS